MHSLLLCKSAATCDLRIGVRSEDLRDSPEKSIQGSGIALSPPRLVIPAAIHGLRVLSHQNFADDPFDFQLVPAMSGVFVYKAAVLVPIQVLSKVFAHPHLNHFIAEWNASQRAW